MKIERRILFSAALAATLAVPGYAQKMTPEELVKLHLQAPAGDLTVPKRWSLRFERSGNSANEWKYDMAVQTIAGAKAKQSALPRRPVGVP